MIAINVYFYSAATRDLSGKVCTAFPKKDNTRPKLRKNSLKSHKFWTPLPADLYFSAFFNMNLKYRS